METTVANQGLSTDGAAPASGLAQQIEGDILLGALSAGEWLRLGDIEERYDVTRSEVRAAFTWLAAQRVLDHVPNRGYRVINVSEDELVQRVEIRLLLELQIAPLLVERASAADYRSLFILAKQFEASIETASVPELDLANHRFHREMVRLCGNPELERLINRLRERTKPRGWQHWRSMSHIRNSAADHLDMVDALYRKSGGDLRRIIKRHILRVGPGPRPTFLLCLP